MDPSCANRNQTSCGQQPGKGMRYAVRTSFSLQSVLDSQVCMNTNEAMSLMHGVDHEMCQKSSTECFFLEHAGELRVVVLKDRKIGPSYNGESSTELTTGGI